MIHIVFQENDIGTFKKLLHWMKRLQGDVIQIKDDFAVGPLLKYLFRGRYRIPQTMVE